MKSSKTDAFIFGSWVKLLLLYLLMFILSAVVPITAMFPNLGFPCYFINLVKYSNINLTTKNAAKHITPTLFLEAPEMFTYITFSFAVDCISAIYYFIGAYAVLSARKQHIRSLTSLSQWIALVGTPTLVFMGLLRLWTIQLFINTLSYKHIYLAAFVYTAHFLLSFMHIQCYITRNSAVWTISALEQHIPRGTLLHTVIKYGKPITANMHLICLALEMLVFSLSFMMAIGNSFYVLVSDVVFGSINLFLGLTIIWYVITETFLSKYLSVQFGFYIGVVIASIVLILPLIRYEAVFVSAKLHTTVAVNIVVIPIMALVAMLIRAIRILWNKKNPVAHYVPVNSNNVDIAMKKKSTNKNKKNKQNSKGPVLLESESSEDELY